MQLRLFKPLFQLFNLSESRIFSLNSCWVEVLKNREVEVLKKRKHLRLIPVFPTPGAQRDQPCGRRHASAANARAEHRLQEEVCARQWRLVLRAERRRKARPAKVGALLAATRVSARGREASCCIVLYRVGLSCRRAAGSVFVFKL